MYRMSGRWPGSWAALLVLTAASAAAAGPDDSAVVKGDKVDITKIRDSLVIGHDGNGHYIAAMPLGNTWELYFGDGKTFYKQRVFGGGSNGIKKTATWSFWSPRQFNHGHMAYGGNLYTVTCGHEQTKNKRTITFSMLTGGEREAVLARARFEVLPFKRSAMYLLRDRRGVYYFVDRIRGGKGYRLFVGRRGNLKPYKLIDIVDDSEGMIFVSTKGELHLVVDKNEKSAEWSKGKSRTDLKEVPVAKNRVLIYNGLGVYDTVRLGTVCEDL